MVPNLPNVYFSFWGQETAKIHYHAKYCFNCFSVSVTNFNYLFRGGQLFLIALYEKAIYIIELDEVKVCFQRRFIHDIGSMY